MKNFVAFLLLFLVGQNILAQNQVIIDSLSTVLETNISDKQKVDVYNKIVEQYSYSDSINTAKYADKAMDLAQQIHYEEGVLDALYNLGCLNKSIGHLQIAEDLFLEVVNKANAIGYRNMEAKSYFQIAITYRNRSEYSNAINYFIKTLNIKEELNDTNSMLIIYSQIAGLNLYQSQYPIALDYYLKSLKIHEKMGDDKGLAICYNNMGIIHKNCNRLTDAFNNFQKALGLFEKLSLEKGIADCSSNLGTIYQTQSDLSNAMIYYTKALTIRKKLNDEKGLANSYNNIGETYGELGNDAESLNNYLKALEIGEKLNDKLSVAHSLIGIGMNHFRQNEYQIAKKYLTKGIAVATEIEIPILIRHGADYLAQAENALGNYKNAYDAHVLFKTMEDSLQNNEMLRKITLMEADYNFERKIDSINFINGQQQQTLSLQLDNQRIKTRSVLIGFILVLTFGLVLFRIYKHLKITNTKLSLAHVELQKQRDELKHLNNTKNRFFSIIAHDIRGPMGVFLGFYEIVMFHLEDKYIIEEDSELKSIMEELETNGTQLLDLLDGLLIWALKEENTIPYHPEKLNVKACIEKNMEVLASLAKVKHVQISEEVDAAINLWADKNSLLTILRNLTSNAIKFSPVGSIINFNCESLNEYIEIKVIDEGVGIPADKLIKIFEIDNEKTTKGTQGEKGTGLGLNIVRDFVKMNKGTITVQSEMNKGTTFTILLPASQNQIQID